MKLRNHCLNLLKELKHIEIVPEGISEAAAKIQQKYDAEGAAEVISIDDDGLQFSEYLAFQLYFNSINYCFWSAGPQQQKWIFRSQIDGTEYDGSYGLYCALQSLLIDSNKKLLSPHEIYKIPYQAFADHMESSSIRMPLLEQRYDMLKGVALIFLTRCEGSPLAIIEAGKYTAGGIVSTLISTFPQFVDISYYTTGESIKHELLFNKRAQLLVKMWSAACEMFDYKDKISEIDTLTAFADYKVPQLLRYFGILRYSTELASSIENYELLPRDSDMEVEIRIATVTAVHLLQVELSSKGCHINEAQIDSILWKMGQHSKKDIMPYHRTFSTAY